MKIIIEILLLAIIAIGAFIGVRRGFVMIASRPIKFILALVLAFSLCSAVAEAIFVPMIEAPVTNYVTDFLYSNCEGLTKENLSEDLPTLLKLAAAAADVDINEAAVGEGTVVENIVVALVGPVVSFVARIIAFVAVYLLSRFVLFLAFLVIDQMLRHGIPGALNKFCGALLSSFLALIISWALAVTIEFIFHVPYFAEKSFIADFDGGFFYRFFNTYNPLELLLSF